MRGIAQRLPLDGRTVVVTGAARTELPRLAASEPFESTGPLGAGEAVPTPSTAALHEEADPCSA